MRTARTKECGKRGGEGARRGSRRLPIKYSRHLEFCLNQSYGYQKRKINLIKSKIYVSPITVVSDYCGGFNLLIINFDIYFIDGIINYLLTHKKIKGTLLKYI